MLPTAPRPSLRPPRALLRWLLAGVLALALTGCGLGLVYPRLDRVVGFYIEGLVTLDDAQSAALKRTLAGNLQWHRDTELSRYAGFLRDVAGGIEEGPGRSDWLEATARVEDYWRDVFEQAAPGYIALAATFSDAQVAELLENLAEQDEEEWREFAGRSPEEHARRREKSVRKSIERFTGPLDAGQRALVREFALGSRPIMPEWRENRRVWREQLAETLALRSSGAPFEARMRVLVARPDELWTPAYRAALERRRAAFVEFAAALDRTLTPAQRSAARRELLALADEVQRLRRRG